MKLGWRFGLIAVVLGLAVWFWIDKGVTLGLDLKGGSYMSLEVDLEQLRLLSPGANEDDAVNRALEIIRARVDEFGVAEPLIAREGVNRIIVQLPGMRNVERAKELIKDAATLEFKMVSDDVQPRADGTVPAGYEVRYMQRPTPDGRGYEQGEPVVLRSTPELTGEHLTRARARRDSQGIGSAWAIDIEFDEEGAAKFRDVTTANIRRRLAIVLDGKVMSAPVINEPITSGKAQITGGFTSDDAHRLRIILESGSLPAPVKIVEERTIGPTLGADSIRKGVFAAAIGLVVVALFMLIYYRFGGVLANLAVILNLVILLGGMAMMGGTLTLPGIAGIILTIGMAVDANVLIFERMREELRAGKTIRAAVEAGYAKAMSAIVDSNVTTVIAAIILYQFGTGPIKGFAVTLSWGLAASMFTAIFATRALYELILRNPNIRTLSV